jgi:hypothetical protein
VSVKRKELISYFEKNYFYLLREGKKIGDRRFAE